MNDRPVICQPKDAWPEFVLASLPVGVVTINPDMEVTTFNPQAEVILKRKAQDVIGKKCYSVLRAECARNCPVKNILNHSATSVSLDTVLTDSSGQKVPVRMRISAMYDEDGKLLGVVEAFADISEIKELARERDHTLSLFAHDMKTPLISALGLVNRLAEGKTGQVTPKQREYLRIIGSDIYRVRTMVLDFLDIARHKSGARPNAMEPLELATLLEDTGRGFIETARENGVSLSFAIQNGLPELKGNINSLTRAISNLLDNAIRYAKQGEVVLEAGPNPEGWIQIEVKDQGPGLSEEDLERAFESFYRGSAGRGVEGSGLGLAAVTAVVEAHGGQVEARNRTGGGAKFIITLPPA